jgi:hypothetical protein
VVLMLGVDKKGKFCLDFLGEQWVTKIYAHSTRLLLVLLKCSKFFEEFWDSTRY